MKRYLSPVIFILLTGLARSQTTALYGLTASGGQFGYGTFFKCHIANDNFAKWSEAFTVLNIIEFGSVEFLFEVEVNKMLKQMMSSLQEDLPNIPLPSELGYSNTYLLPWVPNNASVYQNAAFSKNINESTGYSDVQAINYGNDNTNTATNTDVLLCLY